MRTGLLRRVSRVVALAALVAAASGGAPPAAAGEVLHLAVAPSTDLVDDQVVTVTGSGFPPLSLVAVLMCTTADTSDAGCDYGTVKDGRTAEDGSFALRFEVERVLDPKGMDPVDCAAAPERCAIVAFAVESPGERAVAPVSFRDVPLPHPLRISVQVRRVGFVRAADGNAVVEGTVTCNRPVAAGIEVELVQDTPDVVGFGRTAVRRCGENVPWRVVVVPEGDADFAPRWAAGEVRARTSDGDDFAEDVAVVYVDLRR